MKEFQEQYEKMISELIAKVGMMKLDQLVSYVAAYTTEESFEEAYRIIEDASKHGVLLISTNGYVMSKGVYLTYAQDKFWDGLNMSSTIQIMDSINPDKKTKAQIDCLWEVVQTLPDSENFIMSDAPWLVQYIVAGENGEKDTLVQVARFVTGDEIPMAERIKDLPAIDTEEKRQCIERIAILDDPNFAWVVPHVGFTRICKLVEDDFEEPFRIITVRKGEVVWNE